MAKLPDDVVKFFHSQHFTIVSTIDPDGMPHISCKGIVQIDPDGTIYLLDLYTGKTRANLERNPAINLSAVDEHKFRGYSLKGTAKIIKEEELKSHIIKAWEEKLTTRIAHRLIKNLKGEPGHERHPEAQLPKPKYLIVMTVSDIVDLTPPPLR
ncbi:MAG: pyridoxamine 5'-phosphate oxidase family protein [Candidatus Omnitrophica bacterium]|nr:pyridoxamine 5'-phosphate oxidase family protein [Candidatus Omnitrophota bacterium]MDD5547195.1 pyridoxamine 5'-phosphate oxidase family protein [Candidatus Omnitrophota bacterium]